MTFFSVFGAQIAQAQNTTIIMQPALYCTNCKKDLKLLDYLMGGVETALCFSCSGKKHRPLPLTSSAMQKGQQQASDWPDSFATAAVGIVGLPESGTSRPDAVHSLKAGRRNAGQRRPRLHAHRSKNKHVSFFDQKSAVTQKKLDELLVVAREHTLADATELEWKDKLQALSAVKEFVIESPTERTTILTEEEEAHNKTLKFFEEFAQKDLSAPQVEEYKAYALREYPDYSAYIMTRYLENKYGEVSSERALQLIEEEQLLKASTFREIVRQKVREEDAVDSASAFFIELLTAEGPYLEKLCEKAQKEYQVHSLGIAFYALAKKHGKKTITELTKEVPLETLEKELFEDHLLDAEKFKELTSQALGVYKDDLSVFEELPALQELELEF